MPLGGGFQSGTDKYKGNPKKNYETDQAGLSQL